MNAPYHANTYLSTHPLPLCNDFLATINFENIPLAYHLLLARTACYGAFTIASRLPSLRAYHQLIILIIPTSTIRSIIRSIIRSTIRSTITTRLLYLGRHYFLNIVSPALGSFR